MLNKTDILIHRLLVAKELPTIIRDIDVEEAVKYVLPMVLKIATDRDDTVRETFISELDKIIMYYYENAPPVVDQMKPSTATTIPKNEKLTNGLTALQEHGDLETISVPAPTVDTPSNSTTTTTGSLTTEKDHNAVTHATSQSPPNNDRSMSSPSQDHSVVEAPSSSKPPNNASESNDPSSRNDSQTDKSSPWQDENGWHIPTHVFAPLLIGLLLDQNSELATLGQQCIILVTSQLADAGPENPLYQKLIDIEIYEGIIMGLVSIVDGKHPGSPEDGDDDANNAANTSALSPHLEEPSNANRRRSSTPGFEGYINQSSSTDEIDQGEINFAKMMCLLLISSLARLLGRERCTKLCLPIVQRTAEDPVFYVRKEAASAIGSLATVVSPEVVTDQLLPLYLNFIRDTIWHVRKSCVSALPSLCSVLPEDLRSQVAVEGVDIFKNDVSRNVRNALTEIIGKLIATFLPPDWETTRHCGKVPDPLLEFFLSLGTNVGTNQMFKLDTDKAIICAYNFPAVVLTAGADYWDSHLKDTYLSLTKDYQIKVRRTFAYSLHEIADVIGPERTERDLVQIFALYLMDLDDVKQGVLEHLAEFLSKLAVSSRNEYIPILAEVWDGVMTNWRLREILAGQLRDIAMLFDAARVVEHILPLTIRACHDEFAAVRETGMETFPVILDIVKRAVDEDGETLSQVEEDGEDIMESKRNFALALLSHVMEKLDQFVHADMYRGRLIFAQLCRTLLEAGISVGDFASFFLTRLVHLATDPVVNVRIATSRTMRAIYLNDVYLRELYELSVADLATDEEIPAGFVLDQALYMLALDDDDDVREHVIDLVDPQRLQQEKELLRGNIQQATEDNHSISESHSQQPSLTLNEKEDHPASEKSTHDAPEEDEEDEPVGTPMDYTVTDKQDEDGDETMTEAEVNHQDHPMSSQPPDKNDHVYLSKSSSSSSAGENQHASTSSPTSEKNA
ncbi:armadillo-type protein [Radiomyces spectabilis]|uniref:armadillo-type protein n=1 Tax=Radiomyces spectabilis TaxID=64574 RepID=UPI00221EEA40|nr:armadillo-type protein [Radiomyces spectabilis]KAI8388520.1 armadillo-type protein [Radiomyces spectabilis]